MNLVLVFSAFNPQVVSKPVSATYIRERQRREKEEKGRRDEERRGKRDVYLRLGFNFFLRSSYSHIC